MTAFMLLYLLFGIYSVIAERNGNSSHGCSMVEKQWYFPAKTTFKYHLTPKRTQHASCEAKCGQIGQNVSFAPFEKNLKKIGQLKSVIMWLKGNPCTYVINGDVVKSKNCTYLFRCLCRQKTENVTSNFHKKPDNGSQKNHVCDSAPHNWNFTYKHQQIFVTNNKTGYDNCSSLCGSSLSKVVKVNEKILSLKEFSLIRHVKLWVYNLDSLSNRTCHFSYQGYLLEYSNCNKSFRCLCQRSEITGHQDNRNISNAEKGWKVIKDRQFYIHNANLSFVKAFEYCKKLGADIVSFTNPSEYILLARNITLEGKYWVGECSKAERQECLTLEVKDSTSLYSSRREMELFSICSRVANASEILNHPAFVKMIKNMTIDSHKTTKMTRKLNCARDDRASAKAVGAIVGTGVVAVVGCLLILSDIQRIYLYIKGRI